jgi:hypothetical protein
MYPTTKEEGKNNVFVHLALIAGAPAATFAALTLY